MAVQLAEDRVVLLKVRVDRREDAPRFIGMDLTIPDLNVDGPRGPVVVRMPASRCVPPVVERLKQSGEPEYIEAVLSGPADDGDDALPGMESSGGGDGEQDELYDQAVRIVTESRKASISGVHPRGLSSASLL